MKTIQEIEALIKGALSKFDELAAKTGRTDEENAQMAGFLKEAEDLKAEKELLVKRGAIQSSLGAMSPEDQKKFAKLGADDDLKGVNWTGRSEEALFVMSETSDGNVEIKVANDFAYELPKAKALAIVTPEYKSAFLTYCRKGAKAPEHVFKALSEGEDTEGGYLIPPEMLREILRRETAPTGLVDEIRMISIGSDVVKLPVQDYTTDDKYRNPFRLEWTGERAAPSNSTDITWGEWRCDVHEAYMKVPVYRSFLEDYGADIQSYISEEMRDSYRMELEYYFSTGGNGVSKPTALFDNPGGTKQPDTVNIGNAVTPDGLKDLINSIPSQYEANGKVGMNKTNVWATLNKLTKTDQGYVFGAEGQQDNGLAGAPKRTLEGLPIFFAPFYNDGGAGNNIISAGDHRKAYIGVQRVALSIRIEDLPSVPYVQIVARLRIGGKVYQSRALKIGKQS